MQSACICYNRVSIFSTEQENKTRWKNIEVSNLTLGLTAESKTFDVVAHTKIETE